MSLRPALLRPENEEIHDNENKQERRHLSNDAAGSSGGRGALREGRSDQNDVSIDENG